MTGDLFGFTPPERRVAAGEVALVMVLHHQTHAAWLLDPNGDRRAAKWIPKSQCRRGEGRDESVWTMPRGLAVERGWL
ncbi:hypothetical protein [Brevundimonas sp. UBA5866]|uniref:hypothetical protein n=1 Tax=Brevundimonas sp. UBA5866 TaxID=1946132 RepID=UPI0025BAB483|nr:hypothetical protein [Brevundimonas sp. UBA5866]